MFTRTAKAIHVLGQMLLLPIVAPAGSGRAGGLSFKNGLPRPIFLAVRILVISKMRARSVLLCLFVAGVVLDPAPALGDDGSAAAGDRGWICEYRVSVRDLWSLRCYDPAVLIGYDPVTNIGQPVVWDVPLWGPPISDERAAELARAVLCARVPGCAVRVVSSR